MKKIETEEKLSMTRELRFKELQEKIDDEETNKIVEEAIAKSKKKVNEQIIPMELEKEIDELLELESKKQNRRKKVLLEDMEDEKVGLLNDRNSEEDITITKVSVDDELYLTSSFKPFRKRIKTSKVVKFFFKLLFIIALLGSFIYFVVLPLYKMLEDSRPESVFDHTLDYLQEQANLFLDSNIPIDSENYSLEAIFDIDSNVKDLKSYVDNDFVFNLGYSSKDNLFKRGYYVQNKEKVKHGITYIEKDNYLYTKMTTNDNYLKHGLVEDKRFLIDDKLVNRDDYKYYIDKLIKVLKESINEEDLVANKEELEIDGITIDVVRNSLELNKEQLLKLEKEIKSKLLKDEYFLKVGSVILNCSLDDIKKSYSEESNYEEDYVLSFNIYTTKGTKFVGFDIEENGFRNYYFYKYENKFEAHVNLSANNFCIDEKDCMNSSRTVIDFIGTTKNDKTKVDVFLNDNDIGSLNVFDFNSDRVDFDYNIVLSDIKYQGDVLLEYNKGKKKYDVNFSLKFKDDYVKIVGNVLFDSFTGVADIDSDKVLDFNSTLSTQENLEFYSELDKLLMKDSYNIYIENINMIETLFMSENKKITNS